MEYWIEYGSGVLKFEIAEKIEIRGMSESPDPLPVPDAIVEALNDPIDSESLVQIARNRLMHNPASTVIIVVSDHTRPVPYYGKDGLIYQIIKVLHQAGFLDRQITILVGAGSHRNMDEVEIEKMIGLSSMGLSHIKVINHEYDRPQELIEIGVTNQGSQVLINKRYYQADLKIVTGLVESHFMAGASGGRKGICPAIVGKETLTIFHGAKFLGSQKAADLNLEGNPLHDEASEIASMAGCDFLVNVTLDPAKKITGVFTGDLFAAHQAAVDKIREYVTVPLDKLYDIVLVPAGFVGINHYQAAKSAIVASRAVKKDGIIIIVAKNTDQDPIGGDGYKNALALLAKLGKDGFMQEISQPGWPMIQEQWQVQMWCKVLDIIGEANNLYYCALEIQDSLYQNLPGIAGIQMLTDPEKSLNEEEKMKLMVERSILNAVSRCKSPSPSILMLKDGPYGIPLVSGDRPD